MDTIAQLRGRLQQAWLKDLMAGRQVIYRIDGDYVYIGDNHKQSIIPLDEMYLNLDRVDRWPSDAILDLMRRLIKREGLHQYDLDGERVALGDVSAARLKALDDDSLPPVYLSQANLNALLPSSYRHDVTYYADDRLHIVIHYCGKPIAMCCGICIERGDEKNE